MEYEKKLYIETQLRGMIQYWAGITTIIGSVVFLLLGVMDYYVTPENFNTFMIYRTCVTFVLMLIYFCSKLNKGTLYYSTLFIVGVAVSAVTIELMILDFGGHKSYYNAGMYVLIIAVLGFVPLSLSMSIGSSLLIYLIYVVPLLIIDKITEPTYFIVSNAFMVSILAIAIGGRIFNQKKIISEITLQYELDKEKERLKQYTSQLEELVQQRTKDLAISEQKYRGLFDYASDGVAVYDSGGIIVNVNRKFCDLHGFPVESLIGTNIKLLDASKDDAEKEVRIRRILNGESQIYETKHYRKDGATILFEVSAKALDIGGDVYIQAFHRDIADKKRLQEQLFQSQKMESIGMLAGGLAHDFNNVISAIVGHVELLHEHGNLDADARRKLSIIESSSRRASQMISKLLKFARKGTFEIQPVELNAVIRDTAELMGKTLSHRNVEVHLELDSTLPFIMGDANQMEQVVMNLMVNAADAMPEGGRVMVKTAAKDLGRETLLIHPLLTPGTYVILTVMDSGSGISDDIREKIFDPFFTTKEQGKGTGLGLAMVYGIVKEHKGVVTVASQVGKGTTFEVYVPASLICLIPPSGRFEAPAPERGSVLVIDDQSDVLAFVSETIQSVGYKVISVDNAVFALQLFKEKADEIALVITDIFMPVIDGRDLIRNFKSIKPSVKIIAMSGYQIEIFARQDLPLDDFLRKPFDGIELVKKVNKIVRPYKSLLA